MDKETRTKMVLEMLKEYLETAEEPVSFFKVVTFLAMNCVHLSKEELMNLIAEAKEKNPNLQFEDL
jgi:2-phospho-L-lactate guanylyltransferase (CobY/MobA/RfbA family)